MAVKVSILAVFLLINKSKIELSLLTCECTFMVVFLKKGSPFQVHLVWNLLAMDKQVFFMAKNENILSFVCYLIGKVMEMPSQENIF